MKRIAILAVIVLMAMTIASAVYAQCSIGGFSGSGGSAEGEVINNTCPVMGGAVSKDTPHKATYKGKTVGFCCAGCVTAFNKEPDAYEKKIDALKDKDINERR